MQMQSSPVLSLSPSFDTHSSRKLAEIAARVVEELRAETELKEVVDDLFGLETQEISVDRTGDDELKVEDDSNKSDDFEFAFVGREPNWSPISADEIFFNGQIRPFYPIFNTDLLSEVADHQNDKSISSKPPIRLPLRKLFIESPSCSSSEANELNEIPTETYCVWNPAPAEESPGRCKKSKSTGSSRRWKFRNLLHRSNSNGKDNFVFLNPSSNEKDANAKKRDDEEAEKSSKVAGKPKAKGVTGHDDRVKTSTAQEAHYVSNRAITEEGRRRSFLPYRQELVGFFAK